MSLYQQVNSSGFPLQLAIAHAVRTSRVGWDVLYEEHAWSDEDEDGFIDLVLEDQHKTWLMNIECKRVRDSEWIFLRDAKSSPERRHAKLWVTHRSPNHSYFDWVDVPMDPPAAESQFCVVRGQDPTSRPMLERIAASVVRSTEALAAEEMKIVSDRYSSLRIYQNVIVTTAELKVCEVDVSKINVQKGEIDADSKFVDVPFVRFRKQLHVASDPLPRPVTNTAELQNLVGRRESTVFVVNSAAFMQFLSACEMSDVARCIGAR
jgi:hypothetical protein